MRQDIGSFQTMTFDEMYGRYLDTSSICNKKLDLAYDQPKECRLDIYYPEEGENPWPVIVFFHGGAFLKGDKGRYQLKPALNGIVQGYAVVSVNYRLVPGTPLPGAFEDAKKAVRFIRKHAKELMIDPERIVLWGESSGATLALATGFEESKGIRAIIDWYAAMRITEINAGEVPEFQGDDLERFVFGETDPEELRERINPMTYLNPGIPPVLIEHGQKDRIVDWHVSEELHGQLLKYLPPEKCPLYLISDGQHGVADYEKAENLRLVFQFLNQNMK